MNDGLLTEQLVLDLPLRPAMGRDDFMVAECNEVALKAIEDWANWPAGRLIIQGETGAGKTHLVHVWQDICGAEIISAENLLDLSIDNIPENTCIAVEDFDQHIDAENQQALFHLYNRINELNGKLLITSRVTVGQMELSLKDLASRLNTIPVAVLETPDDNLLSGVLMKLFSDRQLRIGPKLLPYLTLRMERSFSAAKAIVETLDHAALRDGKTISISFARKTLGWS